VNCTRLGVRVGHSLRPQPGDEKVDFVALVGGRLVSCVGAPRAVLKGRTRVD